MTQSRLLLSVAATSDSKGAATFTLQTTEQGYVYEGSVQIPNSPSGALFVAKVLGTFWGQWAGPTNFGPVQTWGGEFLTVTATGLTPNTSFTMTFTGVEKLEEEAEPIPPAAPTSVVSVETATKLVNGTAFAPGASTLNITPPTLTRRLTIEYKPQSGNDFDLALLKVVGTTTGIVYYQATPDPHGSVQAIPEIQFTAIEPSVDATYQLQVSNSGGQPINIWVVASSTNPLILGQDSNPIAIEQPVVVQGIGPISSAHNPVWTYRLMNSYSSILPASGVATQLIAAAPSGYVNFLGTLTIGLTAGVAAVTLADGSGNIFWSIDQIAGQPSSYQLDLALTNKVNATIVSGQTVRVTITYDQMPVVAT